jgi:hypothetical protein
VPWQSGRSATWDVTVVDTLAVSYITQSATNAASVAEAAALRKTAKYSRLNLSYHFYTVAIETLGLMSVSRLSYGNQDGEQLFGHQTQEIRPSCSNASLVIQRFNAVCLANILTLCKQ